MASKINNYKRIILGIETSCDDTSICILRERQGNFPEILAHKSFSQETILRKWGGVVPEIAARNHLQKIAPLLEESLESAGIQFNQISTLGVTVIPGLLGPLLTGLNSVKTISLIHELPIYPVNHLYAHLEAIHLTTTISYPYIGLLVSGGHSIFFLVKSSNEFNVIGSTIDDAAGEAFDKGGKLMGFGYPAGRIIDEMAKQGNHKKYSFPIGLEREKTPNLSFSGVKTSLKNFLTINQHITDDIKENHETSNFSQDTYDLCASYQYAIISALSKKLKLAIDKIIKDGLVKDLDTSNNLPIVVGGGVACNSSLRETLNRSFKNVHFVSPQYCTDNGGMIANLTLRNIDQAIPFPRSLDLDARGKFIDKKDYINLKR